MKYIEIGIYKGQLQVGIAIIWHDDHLHLIFDFLFFFIQFNFYFKRKENDNKSRI
jgi:hypothetical protein